VAAPTLLALLAATAFAAGPALQQRGALQTSAGADDPRFLVQVWRQPFWVLGALVQAVGWVLQAVALHDGSLVLVQVLTTLSLVIALPFGAWLTDQHITGRVWLAALAVLAGIILFILVGSPAGGEGSPTARDWWVAGLLTLSLSLVLAVVARGRASAVQAVLFGSAAGLSFGLQAAVTKVFTNKVGEGVAAILRGWEVYVLIGSALVAFALQQSALKTGALAAAIASANALTLLASICLGLSVFNESLRSSDSGLAGVVAGVVLILGGVVMLARAPGAEPRSTSPARS
jgi:drug/metabolite transporter (DMT)-like permease